MESIQRAVMLLRADAPQTGRGTLKLTAVRGAITADLSTEALPEGSYSLYLFDKSGRPHCAGEITGAQHCADLPLLALQDIAGAAVVCGRTNAFVLKSSGMDWPAVITQFRIARISVAPKDIQAAAEYGMQDMMPDMTQDTQDTIPGMEPHTQDMMPDIESYTQDMMDIEQQKQPCAAPEPPGQEPSCSACPHVIRQDKINPFPSAFSQSEWVRISYPGPAGWWHYISGKIFSGDVLVAKVLGVPGEYGMAPPIWLEGFGTYMRCASPDAHGYWLMFQDVQTGEVLDMGLSPHGG